MSRGRGREGLGEVPSRRRVEGGGGLESDLVKVEKDRAWPLQGEE